MTEPLGLLAPFRIASLRVPNRFVMAPMTRNFSPGGIPTPASARYYARRATGGVGLIITEGTLVARPSAACHSDVPTLAGAEALAGWRRVVDAVHAEGAAIVCQLWHTSPDQPASLRLPEIDSAVDAFGAAAARAHAAGFDGIEVHGGHGYLLDRFLWSDTNARRDDYGGGIRNRARFAADVVREVRRRVPADFPVIFRFSQWKTTDFEARPFADPGELAGALEPLADSGVNAFHASTRRFWLPEFEGSTLNLAGWAKKLTGLPSITVGSVGLADSDFVDSLRSGSGAAPGSFEHLQRRLDAGEFDLVALGRALVSDPDVVQRFRENRLDTRIPFDASNLRTL